MQQSLVFCSFFLQKKVDFEENKITKPIKTSLGAAKSLAKKWAKEIPRWISHCWKKKRDFLIICSKVGGFLILTLDGNEYFVGWKENLLHKYHQKWLPIICESRLMFHHIHPIIRSKVGGFLILSVANCEYYVC